MPYIWPVDQVEIILSTGDPWDGAAVEALEAWNDVGSALMFTWSEAPEMERSCPADGADYQNVVVWADTNCGLPWDEDTLAMTAVWCNNTPCDGFGNVAVDVDVAFNSNYDWAIHDGPANDQRGVDFRRTAIHEFGHVAGLGHPDEFGQDRTAIMNSDIGDLYEIQQDDADGLLALYEP